MSIGHQRLDRFISEKCQIKRKDVRLLVAKKRIMLDGKTADSVDLIVNKFSVIELDEQSLQNNKTLYVMLHKPVGVVCATKDEQHKTVIDLLDDLLTQEEANSLHIVGRLDLNTSGLVLLTNDSRWSTQLTLPEANVEKCYQVTLQNPLSNEYITAFAQGMYFSYEKITTQPAKLTIISANQAQVILTEGRYHQIKRMFGRFRNPVLALHRTAIGHYFLDDNLAVGESRLLSIELE